MSASLKLNKCLILLAFCFLAYGKAYAQQVPANAWGYGDQWFCKDGYRKVGNRCEQIHVPANALVYRDQWFCKTGYRKVGNRCEQIQVPANALVYRDQWFCKTGYRKVGNRCEQIHVPANALVYRDRWFCKSGYTRSGDGCIATREAHRSLTLAIAAVESSLEKLGFDSGEIDGVVDSKTLAALASYQEQRGLTPSGILEDRTRTRLLEDVDQLSKPAQRLTEGWQGSANKTPPGARFVPPQLVEVGLLQTESAGSSHSSGTPTSEIREWASVTDAGLLRDAPPEVLGRLIRDYKGRLVPFVAENGSYYGETSWNTGRPKHVYVRGYYRQDGTYIRGHFRSRPKRRH